MSHVEIFEAEIEDVYHYRLSYGGQSPYFHGLENKLLLASRCSGCGYVWLPIRPLCSKCFSNAVPETLSGAGVILTGIALPDAPEHLRFLESPVATALIRVDGADTCIKAFVVSKEGKFAKDTRVKAQYLDRITSIADFFFVPE